MMMSMFRDDVIITYYIRGDISLNYMWAKYPYIAYELTRQNMVDNNV
jgi:hypothetical protein